MIAGIICLSYRLLFQTDYFEVSRPLTYLQEGHKKIAFPSRANSFEPFSRYRFQWEGNGADHSWKLWPFKRFQICDLQFFILREFYCK